MNVIYTSQFCDECHSMMVIHTAADGSSKFRCRMHPNLPNHTKDFKNYDENKSIDRVMVLVRNYDYISNAPIENVDLIKNDPTLPKIKMTCSECKKNGRKKEDYDVVYTRLNKANLQYQYCCTTCSHSWTNV